MPRSHLLLTPLVPWLLALGSCSSPPKPPTVDESKKRPANSAAEVQLQSCRSDLQNTRIELAERSQAVQSQTALLEHAKARQAAAETATTMAVAARPVGNSVYTVRFGFGSTDMSLPAETAAAMVDEARSAPIVVLRGRTDGDMDNPADSRIARDRAAAVREYLLAAGVESTRIRTTHQPTGDRVADNSEANGRALNRRVEIEVYRALPVLMNPAWVAQPQAEPTNRTHRSSHDRHD
jgi:outer membrane protein OmpA-like peptidoglycan-associated protein